LKKVYVDDEDLLKALDSSYSKDKI
jgi:hypothetical protein